MNKLLSVIDAISIGAGKVASWLVLLVIGFIIYEILMRYVFHLPTLWVSESMVFGAGLTYVLGAAWALQDNRHGVSFWKMGRHHRHADNHDIFRYVSGLDRYCSADHAVIYSHY